MEREEQMAAISKKLEQVRKNADILNPTPGTPVHDQVIASALIMLADAIDIACQPSWKIHGRTP